MTEIKSNATEPTNARPFSIWRGYGPGGIVQPFMLALGACIGIGIATAQDATPATWSSPGAFWGLLFSSIRVFGLACVVITVAVLLITLACKLIAPTQKKSLSVSKACVPSDERSRV